MESDTNVILAFLESMNATKWGLIGIGLVGLELVTGTTYILWPAAAALILAVWVFFLPLAWDCLLYTSPSPRDRTRSRMPSSA